MVSNVSKSITFRQFIETFNFRLYNTYGETDNEKYDTKIIRIYTSDDVCKSNNWFEFGIFDFGGDTWEFTKTVLSERIYNSEISGITYNTSTDKLEIYLKYDCNKEGV